MKKLEDAVRRFGTPDHGRTAKRLRDFEAQLVQTGSTEPQLARDMQNIEGLTLGQSCLANAIELDEMNKAPIGQARDKVIARQYSVIQSLQVLLNQKDEEIDMLRSAPPVRARDLWIAAGLVSLVLLSAYYGFM